jgi:putative transposase
LERIAAEQGWQIVAKQVMCDHGHLFVGVGPTEAPAQVVGAFKGGTAGVLRREFAHLRDHVRVLWSPSYLSESTVRGYIEHHWDAVMAR